MSEIEPLKFNAYYYSFEATGSYPVDLVLSAVARAGKAFHTTEDWSNEIEPYHPAFEGKAPVDWIQNAAVRASNRLKQLESILEDCAEFIDGYVDVVDGDYGEPEPNKAMRLMSAIREVLPV
jgi:hypothetical protein